jgi:hypothetical protein
MKAKTRRYARFRWLGLTFVSVLFFCTAIAEAYSRPDEQGANSSVSSIIVGAQYGCARFEQPASLQESGHLFVSAARQESPTWLAHT